MVSMKERIDQEARFWVLMSQGSTLTSSPLHTKIKGPGLGAVLLPRS